MERWIDAVDRWMDKRMDGRWIAGQMGRRTHRRGRWMCTWCIGGEMDARQASRLIGIRAASPISSPYYSNLSGCREHSGEKSNIPEPGTYNTSSQEGREEGRKEGGGRREGGKAGGRTGKLNGKISREEHRWLRSTPAAIVWLAWWKFDLKEFGVRLFLSPLAKRWERPSRWRTSKEIMECESFASVRLECTWVASAGNDEKGWRTALYLLASSLLRSTVLLFARCSTSGLLLCRRKWSFFSVCSLKDDYILLRCTVLTMYGFSFIGKKRKVALGDWWRIVAAWIQDRRPKSENVLLPRNVCCK